MALKSFKDGRKMKQREQKIQQREQKDAPKKATR